MNSEVTAFPAYRKYRNGKNFFKILSYTSFEEIQIAGTKKFRRTVEAKQHPEKMMILDLLQGEIAEPCDKDEYERLAGEI